MIASPIKDEARRFIDALPESATWEDIMQEMYVRETIDRSLADAEAGRVVGVEELRANYGLNE